MNSEGLSRSSAFWLGARALLPLMVGVAPFGVIYGVVALQSGLSPWAAQAMSAVVFAGSAQFLFAQLAGMAAPGAVIVGAITLINLRHALYSASVVRLALLMALLTKVRRHQPSHASH